MKLIKISTKSLPEDYAGIYNDTNNEVPRIVPFYRETVQTIRKTKKKNTPL